jgi:hypothetical protein
MKRAPMAQEQGLFLFYWVDSILRSQGRNSGREGRKVGERKVGELILNPFPRSRTEF